MKNFQISKFNPDFRTKEGLYLKSEWTSIFDINNVFDDGLLTADKYLDVENNYISALKLIFSEINVKQLKVVGLEKHDDFLTDDGFFTYDDEDNELYNKLIEETILSLQDSLRLIRLIIREKIWCYLVNEHIIIRVGYDFYLNVAVFDKLKCFSIIEEKLNLFIIELGSESIIGSRPPAGS